MRVDCQSVFLTVIWHLHSPSFPFSRNLPNPLRPNLFSVNFIPRPIACPHCLRFWIRAWRSGRFHLSGLWRCWAFGGSLRFGCYGGIYTFSSVRQGFPSCILLPKLADSKSFIMALIMPIICPKGDSSASSIKLNSYDLADAPLPIFRLVLSPSNTPVSYGRLGRLRLRAKSISRSVWGVIFNHFC